MLGYPTGWFSPLSLNGCTLSLSPKDSESKCSGDPNVMRSIILMFSKDAESLDSHSWPFPHYSHFIPHNETSLVYNTFFMCTFLMVENPATDPCIFWGKDGLSFVVRAVPEFTDCVLPSYFEQLDFAKFAFQLSGFGFRFRVIDPVKTEFAKDDFCRATLVKFSAKLRRFTLRKPLPDLSQMELKATEDVYSRSLANLPALLTRTYCMVADRSTDNIISWEADGSFTVRDAYGLSRDLLPKYFNHKSFTIFILQLCVAGFQVTTKGDGREYKFAKEGVGSIGESCRLRREIMTDFLSLSQEVCELEKSIVKMIRKSKKQDSLEGEMQTTMKLKVDTWALKLRIENLIQSSLEEDPFEWEELDTGNLIMKIRLNMNEVKERIGELPSSKEFETTDALMEIRLGITEIIEKMHMMSLQSRQEVTSSPDLEIRHAVMKKISEDFRELEVGMKEMSIAEGPLEATFSWQLEEIEQNMKELTQMIKVLCSTDFRQGAYLQNVLLDVMCQIKHISSFVHKVRQANVRSECGVGMCPLALQPDCPLQSQIIQSVNLFPLGPVMQS